MNNFILCVMFRVDVDRTSLHCLLHFLAYVDNNSTAKARVEIIFHFSVSLTKIRVLCYFFFLSPFSLFFYFPYFKCCLWDQHCLIT